MIIYQCNICNREFKSKGSLSSHKNWHDPVYAEKSKAGARSTHKKISKIIEQQKLNRIEEYSMNTTKCLYCHTEFNYYYRHNKFCNQSCAASYNNTNRSIEIREKQKITLKKTLSLTKKEKTTKPAKQCEVCNSNHYGSGKTCSIICKGKLFSFIMKEKIKNGYNPRKNRGRDKRSYLETSFENWLIENHFNDFETEFHIKRYDENNKFIKNYFIDFYFPTLKLGIELDGTQHKNTIEKDFDRDRYISSLGIEILRISHREYLNKSKVDLIKQKLNIS
jgi:very-short-patch-repair endonuclease